jgi:Transmembrane family 220, helix
MTMVRWILALIAALFAGLQYNDPDPVVWVGLYGSVALALGLAALGRPLPALAWCVVGSGLVLAAISLPGLGQYLANSDGVTVSDAMSNRYPYIELTRELGGAAVAIAMALVALGSRRPRDNRQQQ